MARWLCCLLFVSLIAACSDPAGPDEVDESSLTFLRFDAAALPLVTFEGSFWAVAGRNTELVLRYQPESGQHEGERFLEFKVPGNGLLRRPDGRAFANGDSVQIQVVVDNSGRFLFHFEPAGLQFDPDHPAELRVEYRRADPDLNGDGRVDSEDESFELRLDIWKQERPGLPWNRLGTVRFKDNDEVRAQITGFTGFAVAS